MNADRECASKKLNWVSLPQTWPGNFWLWRAKLIVPIAFDSNRCLQLRSWGLLTVCAPDCSSFLFLTSNLFVYSLSHLREQVSWGPCSKWHKTTVVGRSLSLLLWLSEHGSCCLMNCDLGLIQTWFVQLEDPLWVFTKPHGGWFHIHYWCKDLPPHQITRWPVLQHRCCSLVW